MMNKWSIKARLTPEEKEGMARMTEAIRKKRTQATKAQHEDVKNVEGVRQEGVGLGFELT